MLFRQIIIENQQVTAVVHRRRTVRRDDLQAHGPAFTPVVGGHDRHRIPGGSRITDQRERLRPGQAARRYAELRIRTIQAKSGVAAMNRQVLQLHGAAFGHPGREQFTEQRPVAGKQRIAHEHITHDVVYERRMHAVPTEETGPGEPVTQLSDPPVKFQTEFMAADPHNRYFFNSPARRPVEKAIWRL